MQSKSQLKAIYKDNADTIEGNCDLLFFKADQADAVTAAFAKYTEKVMGRSQEKPSILGQLRKFSELIKTHAKERQKTREAVKEER